MILICCLFVLSSYWQSVWVQYTVGGPEVEEEQWAPSASAGSAGNVQCHRTQWPRGRWSRGTKQKRAFREEERADCSNKTNCQALGRAIRKTRPRAEIAEEERGVWEWGLILTSPWKQELTFCPKMNSAFLLGQSAWDSKAPPTDPDLNSQRIRHDFSLSLSCKTRGGHKMCKPDPKAGWIWMHLWQVHVGAGEKKRKQSRVMDRSIQGPLPPTDTGSFPIEKSVPLAGMAPSSACLWEWQHTQMWVGLLSLLSNQVSEKHTRVEMFAGRS